MPALTPLAADWDAQRPRLLAGRLMLALDYDGTLVPIADRPDLATFDDEGRALLRALATRHDVAIVTGRALPDVRALVGVDEVTYAGNHGFEIEGPSLSYRPAPELPEIVEAAGEDAQARLTGIEGVVLERKGYSLSVHYRLVDEAQVPGVRQAVDAVVAAAPGMKLHHGKKVFEIRSDRAWHKGAAVGWLVDRIDDAAGRDRLPRRLLALGDDVTDEDMFREVTGRGGLAVRVGPEPAQSVATHRLPDPAAAREILATLV